MKNTRKIFCLSILITFFLIVQIASGFGESLKEKIKKMGLQSFDKVIKISDFELKDLDGNLSKLSSYNGKIIFLNFWATYCPPCREEMPSMQKLYAELKDKGFVILGVDIMEDVKTVNSFVLKNKLTFPVLIDKTGGAAREYGVRHIPTTIIIDRNGNMIAWGVGGRPWFSSDSLDLFNTLLNLK